MADANELNMACFRIVEQLDSLQFVDEQAKPLIRRLLRVAGRAIIDSAGPDASAEHWQNAEEMALLWIAEALEPLGYTVRPVEGSGKPELPDVSEEWH